MPVDGCVYLKASDGTLVPLSRVGPQGPKGDPGIPVAPTAADEGKVLVARSQSAVWEASPAGGDTLTQAQADARYLRLTGGKVETTQATLYGHSLILSIADDEGLMLGTLGPLPNAEFNGIIWTPPMIPGDEGSRVQLASTLPIELAAPDGTQPNELVSKGYVDSRIWSGSQAQYDALPIKQPDVLYVIV
jgi:hypothetical protein